MFWEKTDINALRENLTDAGCSPEFIEKFLKASDSPEEQLRLLSCQRCKLLDDVHEQQKKLECLDYLRHILKKQKCCPPAKEGKNE